MLIAKLLAHVLFAAVGITGVDGPVVVLLGDSTTVAAEVPAGEKFSDVVSELLHRQDEWRDVRVVNSGKGGDTARGALGRVDRDVAAHDPDLVAVSFGLNDLGQRKPQEFERDMQQLVEAIRSRTRAQIILVTSSPFDDRHTWARKAPYAEPGSLDAALDSKFNAAIRQIAQTHGLPLCDKHHAFHQAVAAGKATMADLLLADGVHLTAKGNRIAAEAVVPTIETALRRVTERSFPGVLPKPKEYRETGESVLLAPADQAIGIQVLGQHPALRSAERQLIERVKSLDGVATSVPQRASVRIGVASDLPPAASIEEVREPQGYTLSVNVNGAGQPEITIRGLDPLGTYYGVQTLIQLLDRSEKGVTVRQAQVRDWPTFTYRLFKGQEWYYRDNHEYVGWMSQFKWNVFGSCYTDAPDWRQPPSAYRQMIAELCDKANSDGTVQVIQLGNPYMLKDKAIRASAPGDIETLADFFEPSLSRGTTSLMLCLDDFAYLPQEDSGSFKSLAGANVQIVTRFAEKIWSRHPGTRILLCPPPYWLTADKAKGYEWAHDYLRELSAAIPPEIEIVWTGQKVTTPCQQAVDIDAYQQLVGPNRRLFLWDNTLKLPPGWGNVLRQNAFLATCSDLADSAWPRMASYTHGGTVINTYGPGEVYKVPLMTAADYLWNPEKYDPQDSMQRALYWLDPNPRVGRLVYRWVNGLHQQLFTKRLDFLSSPTPAGLDELRKLTDDLASLYDRIAGQTKNKTLVAALKPYLRRHTEALPILVDVLAAYQKNVSEPAAAKQQLGAAHESLAKLAKALEKGDIAEDRHGLVLPDLENASLKAIQALSQAKPASKPGS